MTNHPPEVVCIVPFWSQSDAMNWDSNYQFIARTLPDLMLLYPDWRWIVLWPMKNRGRDSWKWHDDGLFRDSRVIRYPWPYDTQMRSSVLAWDPIKFADLEQRFAPTLYWLHQVESGIFMDHGYQQTANDAGRPYIIAQHHYIIHDSLPYYLDAQLSRLWMQMGGTLAADRVIMNSHHARRMMIESFGTYLASHKLRQIDNKTEVVHFGLVDESHSAIPIRKTEKPVILYNHRFEGYKNHKDTATVLNMLRQDGYDFEVWVTQTVGQPIQNFPVDRAVGHPDFDQYLDNISVRAINTINSYHETFCISMLDSIMLGHLPVVPKSVTFPELVPDDYPYQFKSMAEQRHMLAHILQTWPAEYEKWSPTLRAFAARRFGKGEYITTYGEILTSTAAIWHKSKMKQKHHRNYFKFLDDLPDGRYELQDVGNRWRTALGLQTQSSPNRRVLRELCLVGGEVDISNNRVYLTWSGYDPDIAKARVQGEVVNAL